MRCYEVKDGELIPGVDIRTSGYEIAVGSTSRIKTGWDGKRREKVSAEYEGDLCPEEGPDRRVHYAGIHFRSLDLRTNRDMPENGFRAVLKRADPERECGRVLVHIRFGRNTGRSSIDVLRGSFSDGEISPRDGRPREADIEVVARGQDRFGNDVLMEYVLLLKRGAIVRLNCPDGKVKILANEDGNLACVDG